MAHKLDDFRLDSVSLGLANGVGRLRFHRSQVLVRYGIRPEGCPLLNLLEDFIIVLRQVPNVIWAIVGVHPCLVRSWADLNDKIAHKDVQKKVECDPYAISSCEPNLVYESAFGHESRRRYSHFSDLSIFSQIFRSFFNRAEGVRSLRRSFDLFTDLSIFFQQRRRRYAHFADLSIVLSQLFDWQRFIYHNVYFSNGSW